AARAGPVGCVVRAVNGRARARQHRGRRLGDAARAVARAGRVARASGLTGGGQPAAGASVRAAACAVLVLAATFVACEEHEFHPPSREAQVAQADSLYSPAIFDTIAWESDSLRVAVGNDIFGARCRRCHGYLGEGGPAEVRGEE